VALGGEGFFEAVVEKDSVLVYLNKTTVFGQKSSPK
jgi:hypothetical protein